MGSEGKPLGGITTLTLGVASSSGAAPTLPEGGVEIPLLEDRSHYSEEVKWCGGVPTVEHSLRLFTSAHYQLPEELEEGLTRGFVAHIALRSGRSIVVGWSSEALSDRALRLVSCETRSGAKPSSRGLKEWLLESIDGSAAM